jgi:hypothetical protein
LLGTAAIHHRKKQRHLEWMASAQQGKSTAGSGALTTRDRKYLEKAESVALTAATQGNTAKGTLQSKNALVDIDGLL